MSDTSVPKEEYELDMYKVKVDDYRERVQKESIRFKEELATMGTSIDYGFGPGQIGTPNNPNIEGLGSVKRQNSIPEFGPLTEEQKKRWGYQRKKDMPERNTFKEAEVFIKGSQKMDDAETWEDIMDGDNSRPKMSVNEYRELKKKEADRLVNSPNHYKIYPDKETIDIIRKILTAEQFEGYLIGNSLKYRLRAGYKDDTQQDISKAMKYEEWLQKTPRK